MLNSRTSLFVATAPGSGSKSLHQKRHPLSRSYGVNLPSSLTWFLSRTLGFSPHLPVSVCGTDTLRSTLRSFSRQQSICGFLGPKSNSLTALRLVRDGFACLTPYSLRPTHSIVGPHSILRHSIAPSRQYRIINLLSIDYAFRPRLRIRLTPGGRTFPGKP